MDATEMLVQIFFSRETGAGAALAVLEWAHAGYLGPAVFFVDFALMAEEAA